MLTKTFDSAIRGYHYYRRDWHPVEEEHLVCSHEENNAFDPFAIKTCKMDRSSKWRCSANYLFCSCREAQIRHDTRKLNYFAEQIKFCQEAWKRRKRSKFLEIFFQTHPNFPRKPKKRGKGQNLQRFSCRTHQIFLGSLKRRKTGANISEIFL